MKTFLKNLIEISGYTFIPISNVRGYQYKKPLKIKHFLDIYFSSIDPDSFFFLEVGAHDGQHHDHLYPYVTKYNLKGLTLEPQLTVFKQLEENYKDFPNVTCLNLAISNHTGDQDFFTIVDESSLGTFDRSLLSKYRGQINKIKVHTITFPDLIDKFNIKKIDFLQIDCEGYDAEIIKSFDFNRFLPQVINYESILLSDEDREECEKILENHGYKTFRYERDTCAYRL